MAAPDARELRRRRALIGAVVALIAVLIVVLLLVSSRSAPRLGYDISYPQCHGSYPANVSFAIVGVNGGNAHDFNGCLTSELRWARMAPGQRRPYQPRLSLYIDTGNPGGNRPAIAAWPRHGRAPGYGSCNGLLTNACSYLYGEQRSAADYRRVGAGLGAGAPWWLDVELLESWAPTYQLNVAALRGFVAGLRGAGARGPIGIYSTAAQWHEITGLDAGSTAAAFGSTPLRDWVAGTGTTLKRAQRECLIGGFTGLAPALAQYQLDGFDADLRCPTG